jgi:hypothetical protein
MSVVPSEQILRLNCPGYGEENFLTLGRARPLDAYSVIVANPVSILHLFDKDPDKLKEIENRIAEGTGTYTLRSDNILQDIESDLKQRIFELVSFLEKGGLLVYFLCRPFMVQGPSSAMDNYYWLESLAPDSPAELNVRHMSAVSHGRIVEPTEQAQKSEFAKYFAQTGLEWSTIIRSDFLTEGYIVLATAGPRKCIAAHLIAGDNGGRILFLPAPYSPDFDRPLMECVDIWHRSKQAGSAVGMAAEAGASDPPAPYLSVPTGPLTMFAGLDGTAYYSGAPVQDPTKPASNMPPVPKFNPSQPAQSTEPEPSGSAAVSQAPQAGPSESPSPAPARSSSEMLRPQFETRELNLKDLQAAQDAAAAHAAEPVPSSESRSNGQPRNLLKEMEGMASEQPAAPKPRQEAEPVTPDLLSGSKLSAAELFAPPEKGDRPNNSGNEKTPAQPAGGNEQELPAKERIPESNPPASNLSTNKTTDHSAESNGDAPIPEAKDLIKKMEEMTKTVAPDWCTTFSFPDLDDLRKERDTLADTIRQTQAKISAIDNKLASLDGLKNALLAADGEDLKNACSRVFKRLGWTSKQSEAEPKELVLVGQKNAEVIARIVRSPEGAPRPDIAQLAQSVLTFWGETEIEPKGLLIACTFVNTAPKDRREPDFSDAQAEFAAKKSLCLMTTMQLLCMYRDLELGKLEPDQLRNRIIETNGRLPGFELEPMKAKV